MSTLDDLARVERELREEANHWMPYSVSRKWLAWADTIAAHIAAQRERDAERDALRERDKYWQKLSDLLRMNFDDPAFLCGAVKEEIEQHQEARAEVAKVTAAAAQKDAALRAAGVDDPDTLRNSCEMCECDGAECPASCWVKLGNAALSDTAGAGWIDATGAVEVDIVLCHANDPDGHSEMLDPPLFPAEWAGSRVLIVRVAK